MTQRAYLGQAISPKSPIRGGRVILPYSSREQEDSFALLTSSVFLLVWRPKAPRGRKRSYLEYLSREQELWDAVAGKFELQA